MLEVPDSYLEAVNRVLAAVAAYRYYHERQYTIPRHDAWAELCRAMDDLGLTLGPRNPHADIVTGRGVLAYAPLEAGRA